MRATLMDCIRWFTPAQYRQGESDDLKKARIIVVFNMICVATALSFGIMYSLINVWPLTIALLLITLVFLFVLLYFRRTADLRLSSHIMVVGITASTLTFSWYTGGLRAPAVAYFALCPLLPALLYKRRAGIIWTVSSILSIIGLFVLNRLGVHGPNLLQSTGLEDVFQCLSAINLVGLVFTISWFIQKQEAKAIAQVHEAHKALAASHDDAHQAHRSARLLLDSVSDGLLLVNPDGTLSPERSAMADALLGKPDDGASLWHLFEEKEPKFADWMSLCWEELSNDFLPPEVVLDQLPDRLSFANQHLALRYQPIMNDGTLHKVLVIVTNINAELEAERIATLQAEDRAIFLKLLHDSESVVEFIDGSRRLVRRLTEGVGDTSQRLRWLHTLKGNCAVYGISSLASWLHALEDRIEALLGVWPDADRQALSARWAEFEERLEPMLQHRYSNDSLTIDRESYEEAIALASAGAAPELLAETLHRWMWQRVERRLETLGERASELAERLNKPLEVRVDCEPLRYQPSPEWAAFWESLIHIVRNALDHGIESPSERLQVDKSDRATLKLSAYAQGEAIVVEIRDDGRGIDWKAIADRAAAAGLPAATHADRIAALFTDGLSTRDIVTEMSGRGVGASAVWEACSALNGHIDVQSIPGAGTCFRFHLSSQQSQPLAKSA